jgi:hypothetical protein
MAKPIKDHNRPKLTAEGQQLLTYFNEHLLQVVQQVRAVLIAAHIKPEDFSAAFLDEAAQDDYFVKLRASELIQSNKDKAARVAKEENREELSPADKAQADAAIRQAINSTFNNQPK